MKLDLLAIGVHPDDVELGCAGALIIEIKNGKKAGIIDLTQGEMGTRGTTQAKAVVNHEMSHHLISIRKTLVRQWIFLDCKRTLIGAGLVLSVFVDLPGWD